VSEQRGTGSSCVFTPTCSSWANPIEAHFGLLPTFVIASSNYPNHTVATARCTSTLRWRDANAGCSRHPHRQRRERARIRSERQHRWDHHEQHDQPANLCGHSTRRSTAAASPGCAPPRCA
jgi:hypothetical protein